ncbi:uncharacterized protein LOC126092739 [Schistocerca cancellata]|uniref:uncharacterized protein LOC126092739 n=1 Tax=Schistocerca cancellata TaxID=274614 RepID=UPI0021184BB6|nr:uncharacterized protein LOC126092739 [Schistocerca cancellata]
MSRHRLRDSSIERVLEEVLNESDLEESEVDDDVEEIRTDSSSENEDEVEANLPDDNDTECDKFIAKSAQMSKEVHSATRIGKGDATASTADVVQAPAPTDDFLTALAEQLDLREKQREEKDKLERLAREEKERRERLIPEQALISQVKDILAVDRAEPSNTTEPAAVVNPVTTSENVALNVNDFPSLKPALTAEIPPRDSEIPTKKRPLEDTEKNVDENSSCETPAARRPKPSPEDLLEVEKGDGMKVDVAPTSAQGLTPPRTDSDAAGSDFSRKCDPEPEVTAEITASTAQPIQCEQYEEVPSKQPADSEAQRRAEGGNKQASPPRQQDNTTDTTPEPNIDDSQATAVAPFSHRRRLRPTPGLAVTRHQLKATPEKKDIKKKNNKYEVIRANTDEEKENGHSDL